MLSQMAVNQNLSFPIGLGNIGSRSSWVSKSLDQNGCQVNLAARATMTLRIGAGSGLEFMWGQLGFLHAWRVSRPAFECIPHHPEHGMLRHVNCAFCYGCSPSFCSFWKSVQQLRPARSPLDKPSQAVAESSHFVPRVPAASYRVFFQSEIGNSSNLVASSRSRPT